MMRCPQCGEAHAREAVTCLVCGHPLNGAPVTDAGAFAEQSKPPSGKLSPELKEWVRGQLSAEEFLAGVREIEKTGGQELKDFIQELEQEAGPRD
jgi:hypothetical protein